MKSKKYFPLFITLLTVATFKVAVAVPCACGPDLKPTSNPIYGGVAVAFYNGAPFTWDRYVAPVINLVQNGTSTIVTVTNTGNGHVAGVDKFIFRKNMGLGSKTQPDLAELQKILVAENLLQATTTKVVYDSEVRAAVSKFQVNHGIHHGVGYTYGYFGPLTRGFLNAR
jgi:hypothetical protein